MVKKIAMGFLFILLAGCVVIGGGNLHFKGESDNWLVKYTVVDNGNSGQVASYIIDYIGEGNSPESFDYVVSASIAKSEQARTGASFKEKGILEETNIQLGARIQEDEIIVAEFSWDGKTEKVILELK
ncbi:hypothetical protein [Psychrobacillus sp.]|uniref:hypothetical protein n=1 Tax=Psychrobacillus sp. TaxID=1871623 RepID=UPI0028BE7F48|nr:hypothetical protein [Psychrobacillus sp.]